MCILVFGLPSLHKLAVPDDMLATAKNSLSEHTISRTCRECVFQVVGYLPTRVRLYLQNGIP
ncbi:hypothetical protein DL89DRAFT_265117 [Linderina pennispora]|uniref:Uncharacterized protein n=1 Tax=Linderina pennispora TaxID=61395 RepID=A0A1Y1WIL0_9FUNG|nr:uncharacterized protein DL89DRAFT_265117 [Linderina pennispora]ORX72944.1 hypothetical protein DL89DRAFT_265117 [Linderina pennispora]